jgi:hypothetical protein
MKGENLTPAHQRKAAAGRINPPGGTAHNRRIAADAAARQRAKMRAPKGSSLLAASDVHQCWLADSGDLGAPLSEGQRRIVLGASIWHYWQEGWPCDLPRPRSRRPFFALVGQARRIERSGLPLPHPLMIMALAPKDVGRKGERPKDR